MRKLLYILPGLCFLASWSVAETIESVTFNPARLGRYENLKVSDKLTTKGGINAQSVTVQSSGLVSVDNSGNYQADTVDVSGQISMPTTQFITPTLESRGTASFVNTKKSSSLVNQNASSASEIKTLNSMVRVKGNVLKLGNVTVSGATTTDYDDNSASGLTLGGNNIPVPTASCSNLGWISRVADDGNVYKVLGFASCKEPLNCTATSTSLEPENYSDFATASAKDTCDHITGENNGSGYFSASDMTEELCAKGSCIDYYYTGTLVDESTWNSSIRDAITISGSYSYFGTYSSIPQNDTVFAQYVQGKTSLPEASVACNDLYKKMRGINNAQVYTRTEPFEMEYYWNCNRTSYNTDYQCLALTIQCKPTKYKIYRNQWKFTRN